MRRIALLALAVFVTGCPDPDPPAPEPEAEWDIVQQDLGGAILSFWGPSMENIFAVGGALAADGGDAFVLHYNGTQWDEMEVDAPALWWVHGFSDSNVWAVGEHGSVLNYDGETWETVAGGDETYNLWGIWGATPDDIWAVGGTVNSQDPGVLLHYQNGAWSEVSDVGLPGELLFKVWGSSVDDVFIVGSESDILHWDGENWERAASGESERLITVAGSGPDDVYAVGGIMTDVLLNYDGTNWTPIDSGATEGLMALWVDPNGDLVVAGFSGLLGTRQSGVWTFPESGTFECLHAAWGDGNGNYLVGGGNLLSGGDSRGIIVGLGDF